MAEKSAQEDILPLGKMKQVLGQAEQDKIGCAIAMTKDKQVLLFASKIMKPKACATELKKYKDQFDPASLRFGEISVDKADPGTLKFSLNRKEVGGTSMAMTKLVKKAGYPACVFAEDDSLDQEPQATPNGDASGAGETVAAASVDQKARLTGLVQRVSTVLAGQPQLKTTLLALAKEAQAKLADPDPAAATASCDALEQALTAAGAQSNGGSSNGPLRQGTTEGPRENDGGRIALAKSSQLWRACRSSLEGKLDQVKESILAAYADEPEVQKAIKANMGQLDGALDGLDSRLEDSLDAALNATDPGERTKHAQQSRLIIADYIKKVATNQRLAAIDGNPFGSQPGLKEALTKSLSALVTLSKSVA